MKATAMTRPRATLTTIRRALLAFALLMGRNCSAFPADGWQAEPEAVLTPGQTADWDDFDVGSPSIVAADKTWRMYFEGGRLDESGLSPAIGVAMSEDGRTWRKYESNPVLSLESPEDLGRPTKQLMRPIVCRLSDTSWLMTCNEIDQKQGTSRTRILRSVDGLAWENVPASEANLAKAAAETRLFSHSFCANPHRSDRIQLWCLKRPEGGDLDDVKTINITMFQTIDGKSWKQLMERTLIEIEPVGRVRDVQFVADGESWLACYLFDEGKSTSPTLLRFRRSADSIRWKPARIPDYVLPAIDPDTQERVSISKPAALLSDGGVRIFYTEHHENGSRSIASAFFSKTSPRAAP